MSCIIDLQDIKNKYVPQTGVEPVQPLRATGF